MEEVKYKRVLLKISGEALAGERHTGLDFEVVGQVCDAIREAVAMGVQVGVVIGAGNFWRGAKDGGAALVVRWTTPGPTTWGCWAPL